MTILLQNCADLFRFKDFEQKIMHLAQVMKLNLNDWEIDHLALRANHEKTAQDWLTLLLKVGIIRHQNRVNGRTIYLIELSKPISFLKHNVSIIELPMPKKHYPVEGWEHIEVVIPFANGESTALWQERICKQFGWLENSQLKVKVSQPFVEGEQKINPTIAVSLVENAHNTCCIKIHPYNIQSIIEV